MGLVAGNELTLSKLIDEFIYQYDKKDSNISNRLRWWNDHFGHLKLNEISEDHIRHGINTLLTMGSTGKNKISPQTTNRFKANLSSVFEFGKNKHQIKHNPCRQIRGRSEGKERKRYLSNEEQQRFIQAAKQSTWEKLYLLVLMAITTGARKGELIKLRWCDINWDTSQAFCGNTKNGRDKTLPLTEAVKDELKRFREVGKGLITSNPRKPTVAYDFRSEWSIAIALAGIVTVDEKGE